MTDDDGSPGGSASERLGIAEWDRPQIYRELAAGATDNDLPYWTVLVLSGGIATLGLALDSTAVVIGAMLVAPLLAPVMGLALSLAVGDGRLAVQAGLVVLASTAAVIAVAALLTLLLPFQTVTPQISARIQPTTLDLVIAVFSGLVGAIVPVSRERRLSAAIPGVAIAVALIPPLAAAGFGIGIGSGEIVRGSLLLYGANLAGIVLSAASVFLIAGMHRAAVVDAARRWHDETETSGLAALVDRSPLIRRLGVFGSVSGRMSLVGVFAVVLAVPLNATLTRVAREARTERAVSRAAAEVFEQPGRAAILGRQLLYGDSSVHVHMRVATNEWFTERDRAAFEAFASERAGAVVRLSLQQLPARGEDLELLDDLLAPPSTTAASRPSAPAELPDLLATARLRLEESVETIVMPADAFVVDAGVTTRTGSDTSVARIEYVSREPLGEQALAMLQAQVAQVIGSTELQLEAVHIERTTIALPQDRAAARPLAALLARYPGLQATVQPMASDSAQARQVVAWLQQAGAPARSIVVVTGGTESAIRLSHIPR